MTLIITVEDFILEKLHKKPGAMLCQRLFHYPRIRRTLLLELRSHGPQGSSTEMLCSDMYKTKLACIKQLLCVFGLFLKLLKYFAHHGLEAKWM